MNNDELELDDRTVTGTGDVPSSPNVVWDFAHGILHSRTAADENCVLLRKKIQSSGTNRYLKIKSYLPSIFAQIRAVSGVLEEELTEEWDPTIVAQKVAAKGAGKSGALFVVSRNGKFLLKTLRKGEKNALKALAPELLQHFQQYPGSFLSRQYLLCRVEAQKSKQYFVVFNNLFPTLERTPNVKYDLKTHLTLQQILTMSCCPNRFSNIFLLLQLGIRPTPNNKKGAKVNRRSSAQALANPAHVRMDLDEPRSFPVAEPLKSQMVAQIKLDADLLAKHNLMDYSLLVGVVVKNTNNDGPEVPKKKRKGKNKKRNQPPSEDVTQAEESGGSQQRSLPTFEQIWQTGVPSATAPNEHYMIGVIDMLQDYNGYKRLIHFFKVVWYRTSISLSQKFMTLR